MVRQLLKSAVNSKAVIAASADSCIVRILKSTKKGWASILQLIGNELLTSKNSFLQMKCSSYLYIMLTNWDKHGHHGVIDKHLDLLVKVLLSAVICKDEKSRSISRNSYWAFSEYFPNHGRDIMEQLDNPTQKKVNFFI